jgi:DNA-binding transcriptional MerR regulator
MRLALRARLRYALRFSAARFLPSPMGTLLPSIPAKRYFTIGEVAELCGVKPHVLRYWEQEFTQLRPMKRRGNRRYYQHHEVLMIRRIRDLLYDQGFTISGARNKLQEIGHAAREIPDTEALPSAQPVANAAGEWAPLHGLDAVRQELLEIRTLLSLDA